MSSMTRLLNQLEAHRKGKKVRVPVREFVINKDTGAIQYGNTNVYAGDAMWPNKEDSSNGRR